MYIGLCARAVYIAVVNIRDKKVPLIGGFSHVTWRCLILNLKRLSSISKPWEETHLARYLATLGHPYQHHLNRLGFVRLHQSNAVHCGSRGDCGCGQWVWLTSCSGSLLQDL